MSRRSRAQGRTVTRPARHLDSSRRGFLRIALGAAALWFSRRRVRAASDIPAGVSPELLDDLVALAGVLVPPDTTPGIERQDVLAWLAELEETEGSVGDWLPTALRELDETALRLLGRTDRFAGLTPIEREVMVAELLDGWGLDPSRDFTQRIVRPLMTFFYASARGYSVVGYASYTGTSLLGDPDAYTRPGVMPV